MGIPSFMKHPPDFVADSSHVLLFATLALTFPDRLLDFRWSHASFSFSQVDSLCLQPNYFNCTAKAFWCPCSNLESLVAKSLILTHRSLTMIYTAPRLYTSSDLVCRLHAHHALLSGPLFRRPVAAMVISNARKPISNILQTPLNTSTSRCALTQAPIHGHA